MGPSRVRGLSNEPLYPRGESLTPGFRGQRRPRGSWPLQGSGPRYGSADHLYEKMPRGHPGENPGCTRHPGHVTVTQGFILTRWSPMFPPSCGQFWLKVPGESISFPALPTLSKMEPPLSHERKKKKYFAFLSYGVSKGGEIEGEEGEKTWDNHQARLPKPAA